jgi:hypothetical protein
MSGLLMRKYGMQFFAYATKLETQAEKSFREYAVFCLIASAFMLIGAVSGTFLDGFVDWLQEKAASPWWVCLLYAIAQIQVSLLVYFFSNWYFNGSVKNWLFTTSAGFLFSLLYFGVQNNFYVNIRKTFAFLPQTGIA